jgi:hypothetical protein
MNKRKFIKVTRHGKCLSEGSLDSETYFQLDSLISIIVMSGFEKINNKKTRTWKGRIDTDEANHYLKFDSQEEVDAQMEVMKKIVNDALLKYEINDEIVDLNYLDDDGDPMRALLMKSKIHSFYTRHTKDDGDDCEEMTYRIEVNLCPKTFTIYAKTKEEIDALLNQLTDALKDEIAQ